MKIGNGSASTEDERGTDLADNLIVCVHFSSKSCFKSIVYELR